MQFWNLRWNRENIQSQKLVAVMILYHSRQENPGSHHYTLRLDVPFSFIFMKTSFLSLSLSLSHYETFAGEISFARHPRQDVISHRDYKRVYMPRITRAILRWIRKPRVFILIVIARNVLSSRDDIITVGNQSTRNN